MLQVLSSAPWPEALPSCQIGQVRNVEIRCDSGHFPLWGDPLGVPGVGLSSQPTTTAVAGQSRGPSSLVVFLHSVVAIRSKNRSSTNNTYLLCGPSTYFQLGVSLQSPHKVEL